MISVNIKCAVVSRYEEVSVIVKTNKYRKMTDISREAQK